MLYFIRGRILRAKAFTKSRRQGPELEYGSAGHLKLQNSIAETVHILDCGKALTIRSAAARDEFPGPE
jgi:hypothetical protein